MRVCAGKPLVDYTINTALNLFDPADIVVTSDDERLLDHARHRGLVALPRPAFLAQDDTPMIAVIQHALYETSFSYERLLLLQPTSPYRDVVEIRAALSRLETEGVDMIASVSAVPNEFSPHLMMKVVDGQIVPVLPGPIPTRRQDAPRAFLRNGQFYAMRTKPLAYGAGLFSGKTLAFETTDAGVNLDTEADWTAFVARQKTDHAT